MSMKLSKMFTTRLQKGLTFRGAVATIITGGIIIALVNVFVYCFFQGM